MKHCTTVLLIALLTLFNMKKNLHNPQKLDQEF
jgi:hypothetical protein